MGIADRITAKKLSRFGKPSYPSQSRFKRFVILGIVLWLAYVFIGSNHGVVRIILLQREKARLEKKQVELKEQLKRIELQSKLTQKDPFYIEKVARENYGLARKGEIIYRVEESK